MGFYDPDELHALTRLFERLDEADNRYAELAANETVAEWVAALADLKPSALRDMVLLRLVADRYRRVVLE